MTSSADASKRNISPTVDVVIPAFNAERFVRETVMSALAQSYPVRRVIVADDASTDRTRAILEEINDRRLQVVSLPSNGGEPAARNAGLRLVDADFVAFLDADDVWSPTKIERQLDVFRCTAVPNCGVVYCGYSYIDELGKPTDGVLVLPRYRGNLFARLIRKNLVSGSASGVLIARACIAQVGEFDERLKYGSDWDYWLRCSDKFNFDFVEEPVVQIRLHGGSIQGSIDPLKRRRRLRDRLSIVSKWSRVKPLPSRYYNEFRFEALLLSARRRKWLTAYRAMLKRLSLIDPMIGRLNAYSWIYICCKLLYTRRRYLLDPSLFRRKFMPAVAPTRYGVPEEDKR